MNDSMEVGLQPLDAVLDSRSIGHHALVAASTEHLTHKMVAKGRRGRKLTRNTQGKILKALNKVLADRDEPAMTIADLFNYRGR